MHFVQKYWQRLKWAMMPQAEKKQRLDAVLDILQQIPETRSLLELAEKNAVPISFDPSLIGGAVRGVFTRSKEPGKTRIRLRPEGEAGMIAATLTHELRHMWQAEVMDLRASKLRGEFSNPAAKIIVTRVKEADAFAFTHYIVQRVARMHEDLAALPAVIKQINPDADASSLTDDMRAKINAHFHEKQKAAAKEDLALIRTRFMDELKDLGGYDRRTLGKYQGAFLNKHAKPRKPAQLDFSLDMPRLRKILRAGVDENAPDYMAGISDADLTIAVLAPVAPEVRTAAQNMAAFEKAVAKGELNKKQTRKARREIAKEIRALLQTRPPKKLPKAPLQRI